MTAASMWSFVSIYMILEEEGAVPRISCKVMGPSPERHANNTRVSLTLPDTGAKVTVADGLTATGGATTQMHAPIYPRNFDWENPRLAACAMPGC